jgi:hypothetical protein
MLTGAERAVMLASNWPDLRRLAVLMNANHLLAELCE